MSKARVDAGWHEDLSNSFYHGESLGTSSSFLKKLLEHSPAKVLYQQTHPTPPSEAMRLGTAVHSLVMEADKFHVDNVVISSNGWKAVQSAMEDNPDKNIISEAAYEKANRMAENVLSHPMLKIFFSDGIAEGSIYQWYNGISRDDNTDYKEMIKVRPDFIPKGYPVIIDLKSSRDASFTGFADAVIKFRYDLSAAMYKFVANNCKELLEKQGIHAFTNFIFVVVENEAPYQIAWYELSEKDFFHGQQLFEMAMFRLHRARRDEWPSYVEECQTLELPAYSKRLKTI